MEMVKQTVPRKSTFIENVDIEVCYPKTRDNESFIGVYDIGDAETCDSLITATFAGMLRARVKRVQALLSSPSAKVEGSKVVFVPSKAISLFSTLASTGRTVQP